MRKKLSLEDIKNKAKLHADRRKEVPVDVLAERIKIIEEFKALQSVEHQFEKEDKPIEELNTAPKETLASPTQHMGDPKSNEYNTDKEFKKIRTQSEHNTDTDDKEYEHKANTNKNRYAHNTNTESAIISNIIDLGHEYEHNTNTDDKEYEHKANTNKNRYAHNTNTISGHDKLQEQTSLKREVKNKGGIEWAQSAHNTNTKRTQYEHKAHTIRTQSAHNEDTKRTQYEHNTNTNTNTKLAENLIYSLPKNEYQILNALISICVQNNSLISPKINYKSLAALSEVSEKSVKNTVVRLKRKGLVIIEHFFKGPGASNVYSIDRDVYTTFLQYSAKNLVSLKSDKYAHKAHTNTNTDLSSKLVSNIINQTNNTNTLSFTKDDLNWQKLQDHLINNKEMGDSLRNINKFLKNHPEIKPLEKEDVQNFIDIFYEYANTSHGKIMKNKAAVFISELQRLQKEGTCATIEWEQDNQFKIYEEFVQRQEKEKSRRMEIVQKAKDLAYEEWRKSKSKEDLIKIVPEKNFMKYGEAGYELSVKGYFMEYEWEIFRKEKLIDL